MGTQGTFFDLEMEQGARRRPTRRRDFLDRLDAACPWAEWAAEVERARLAAAEAAGRDPSMGRPPVPAETMLRMYAVQVCFDLSDEGCEEQVWDSTEFRSFVGVAPSEVPDATSLCRFRRLLESCSFGARMLDLVNESLAADGLEVSPGSVVDATFVESPSSTKNASGRRDPDAHQAKKGQNWHFGYKLGVGSDARTGVPHSVRVDAANVSDLGQLPGLVRPADGEAWLDAGYTGVAKRPEVEGDPHLSEVEWHVAKRRSTVGEADLAEEAAKSSVRCGSEHVFHVVKDTFGIRKVRLKGREKVTQLLTAAVAFSAALIGARGRRPDGPPAALAACRVEAQAARLEERRRKAEERARRKAEAEAKREARLRAKIQKEGAAAAA